MSDLHPPTLSASEWEAFHEQGYLRLGKAAPDGQIQAMCRRIDDIMLGKVRYDRMLMQLCPSAGNPELSRQTREFKGSSLKYRKIQDLEQDPIFLTYIQLPLFYHITRRFIGERVSVFRSMFFNKPAEQGVLINWHQDGSGGWGLNIPAQDYHLDRPGRYQRGQRLPADHSQLTQERYSQKRRPFVRRGNSDPRPG